MKQIENKIPSAHSFWIDVKNNILSSYAHDCEFLHCYICGVEINVYIASIYITINVRGIHGQYVSRSDIICLFTVRLN